MGIATVGFDERESAEGLRFCDFSYTLDISDTNQIIQILDNHRFKIIGALSISSEAGVLACSRIREHYGLQGLRPDIAERFLNKYLQRQIWEKEGVPIPKWVSIDAESDLVLQKEELHYPIIVKPSDSSGSRGITVINSYSELEYAIETAKKFSKNKMVLMEEFVVGTEFTVEVFVTSRKRLHVLMVTEKRKVSNTNNTVASRLMTSKIKREYRKRIEETVAHAFSVLNLPPGPGHAEVFLQSDGCTKMVEVAARGGGFGIFDEMIFRTTGFDIITSTINVETGIDVNHLNLSPHQRFSILDFIPTRKGVVNKISIDEEWMLQNNVFVELLVELGSKVDEPKHDGDRLCGIIVTEDSEDTALKVLGEAKSRIEIEVV
jgi:pyruvate carboxylase